MRHHNINDRGDHWGVGSSTDYLPGQQPLVLVQLQEKGEQARVMMSPEQAEDMAAALLAHAAKVREAKPIELNFTEEQIQALSPEAQVRYRQAHALQEESKRAAGR